MKTFEVITKQEFLEEQQKHFDQDQIKQGDYGQNGEGFSGCWMGCASNSLMRAKGIYIPNDSHKGIAKNIYGSESCEWLVRLNEKIFESLTFTQAQRWVLDSAEAIPEGILSESINSIQVEIKIWILEGTKKTHKNQEVHKVTDLVISALKSGNKKDLARASNDAAAAAHAATAASYAATAASYAGYAATAASYAGYATTADAAYVANSAAAAAAKYEFYSELSAFVILKLKGLQS